MDDIIESISTCFSKYATFKGRASRKEFWWFFLFSVLMTMLLDMWASVHSMSHIEDKELFETISAVMGLTFVMPSIAVGARRLHDIGKSGWWQLLMVTIIGFIPVVVWWARVSDENINKYNEKI